MLQRTARSVIVITIMALILGAYGLFNLAAILPGETLSEQTVTGARFAALIALAGAAGLLWRRRSSQKVVERFFNEIRWLTADGWKSLQGWVSSTDRPHRLIFVAAVVIAVGLRLLFLNQPIRTDEAVTYLRFASRPLYLALSDYAAPNNHLLHTLLVHLSTRFFGDAEWAIRLPAFLAGILIVPVSYLTVNRLYHRESALFTACLTAVSSVLIEYSTNARGYTLQVILFLLCVVLAHTLCKRASLALWGLLVIVAVAGFYTIPTLLYGLGGIMLWLLISILMETPDKERISRLKAFFAAGIAIVVLTLLLYIPVFIVSGVQAVTGNIYVGAKDDFWQQFPASLTTTWQQWNTSVPGPVSILLAAGFIIAVIWHGRIADQKPLFVIPALLWTGCLLVVQRVVPFTRVWLYFLPLYFGVAAAGIAFALQRILVNRLDAPVSYGRSMMLLCVLVAGWTGFTVVQTQSPYTSIETGTFRDAEAVTLFLKDRLQAGDKVLYEHPSGEALMYYFHRHDVPQEYREWDYLPRDSLYVVVNTEYPQTIASVLQNNGLHPQEYTAELLRTYSLAAVYRVRRN